MSSTDFVVSAYAPTSFFLGPPRVADFAVDQVVPTGMVIDPTLGDPGHPGVSELANNSNPQANASLQFYGYSTTSDHSVRVNGRVSGGNWLGTPAIFERTYRVFTTPAPVPPPTSFQDYSISAYAPGGVFWYPPSCVTIGTDLVTPAGWVVDRGQGDPGHPGVGELSNTSNAQANASLQGYTYAPTSDTTVRVDGRICGSSWWGPGAVFARTFRVFLVPA
jgi:hypothetical protein